MHKFKIPSSYLKHRKNKKYLKSAVYFFVHSKADHELKMLEADEHVGKGVGEREEGHT